MCFENNVDERIEGAIEEYLEDSSHHRLELLSRITENNLRASSLQLSRVKAEPVLKRLLPNLLSAWGLTILQRLRYS